MATVAALFLPIRTLFLSVLLLLHIHQSSCQQKCYEPSGIEGDSLPCYPELEGGPCCFHGWTCLSNGLCTPGPEVPNFGFTDFYRPDCTDPTWNSPLCFSGCNDFSGNGLRSCGDADFCCYNMTGCNCSETSLFQLGQATTVTTLPLSSRISMTSSTTASASVTIRPPDQNITLGHSTAISSTATSTSGSTDTSNTKKLPARVDASTIGAGVGIGLGIPLVIVAIYLTVAIKRSMRDLEALSKLSKSTVDTA